MDPPGAGAHGNFPTTYTTTSTAHAHVHQTVQKYIYSIIYIALQFWQTSYNLFAEICPLWQKSVWLSAFPVILLSYGIVQNLKKKKKKT